MAQCSMRRFHSLSTPSEVELVGLLALRAIESKVNDMRVLRKRQQNNQPNDFKWSHDAARPWGAARRRR